MTFRDRLLATLKAFAPVLDVEGVVVVGSEVPNLMESGAASTLVVSQDVDIGIPVNKVAEVKVSLSLVKGFRPSSEEPSVWLPEDDDMIEANFLGLDSSIGEPEDTYVRSDPELPLLVFGTMGWIRPGARVEIDGVRFVLPRPASLALEKLLTDRTAEKGVRDLLVVAGLLATGSAEDDQELVDLCLGLNAESLHAVRANLTMLSLIARVPNMPDPAPQRERVARILAAIGGA